MMKMSVGPAGEFFIESGESLTTEDVEVVNHLYSKIIETRFTAELINAATRISNEGE